MRKTIFIFVLLFSFLSITAQNKKATMQTSPKGEPQTARLNLNKISAELANDGTVPYLSIEYPKGSGKTAVFTSGLVGEEK